MGAPKTKFFPCGCSKNQMTKLLFDQISTKLVQVIKINKFLVQSLNSNRAKVHKDNLHFNIKKTMFEVFNTQKEITNFLFIDLFSTFMSMF